MGQVLQKLNKTGSEYLTTFRIEALSKHKSSQRGGKKRTVNKISITM